MMKGRAQLKIRVFALVLACTSTITIVFWMGGYFSSSTGAISPSAKSLSVSTMPNNLWHGGNKKHRIAIVIPFVGYGAKEIPQYLDLFCTAAQGSASLVDFLIIHNGAMASFQETNTYVIPQNVIFINLGSTLEMAKLIIRVADRRDETKLAVKNKDILTTIVKQHLDNNPYALVEYKPALGHIFAKYLEDYSHWGYSDLDILFGDLPRWITEEELTDYDIVTYGYGDQNRVYLRGQFTFHKNDPEKINQLWRECKYLSELDERFSEVLAGKQKLRIESAEGCYSSAVLKQTSQNIRVKYAVKAFTDAKESKLDCNMGIFLGVRATGKNSHREDYRSIIFRTGANDKDGRNILQQLYKSTKGTLLQNAHSPLQLDIGEKEVVTRDDDTEHTKKCMYWVQEKYQANICVPGLESTDTVFFIDGQLFKQQYETSLFIPGSSMLTAPFFHFQEWKRTYRTPQVTTLRRSSENDDKNTQWVVTKQGAIPLPNHQNQNQPYWKDMLRHSISSPLGLHLQKWTGAKREGVDRQQLPNMPYCLRSSMKKYTPVHTSQCNNVLFWQDEKDVEIIQNAPHWKHTSIEKDVTLALTLQVWDVEELDDMLDLVEMNILNWKNQPCVLVIHISGTTRIAAQKVRNRFVGQCYESCLVAAIFETDEEVGSVSRKALLNMASDVAPTRWVITGLEVERGVILSEEASFFARRQAEIYADLPGHVFVIPEFAIKKNTPTMKGPVSVSRFLEFEIMDDDEYKTDAVNVASHYSRLVEILWHNLTSYELAIEGDFTDENASLTKSVLALNEIQVSLAEILASNELQFADVSPIIMTDNIGPRNGLRTMDLVREVEEFGGMRCFDVLRLSQLAAFGYTVTALPGAFATLSALSATAACGRLNESRRPTECDLEEGCFMFEDHEKIVKAIAHDEKARPAMAAVLWNEISSLSS